MSFTSSTQLAPVLVIVISIALLIPGITQPMITLQADMNRQALVSEGRNILKQQQLHPAVMSMADQFLGNLKVQGQSKVYDKTRSILGTAEDLWNAGFRFVAVLILTFSVVIPLVKVLTLLLAMIPSTTRRALWWNTVLSKWSMADVFAIGVIIAMLAANAASTESVLIQFHAEVHSGFYWFVAYCLISNLASQLLIRTSSRKADTQN